MCCLELRPHIQLPTDVATLKPDAQKITACSEHNDRVAVQQWCRTRGIPVVERVDRKLADLPSLLARLGIDTSIDIVKVLEIAITEDDNVAVGCNSAEARVGKGQFPKNIRLRGKRLRKPRNMAIAIWTTPPSPGFVSGYEDVFFFDRSASFAAGRKPTRDSSASSNSGLRFVLINALVTNC